MKNVVWRLLRKNISASQLIGYSLANLVGLSIILTALQFYRDVNSVWQREDSFINRDYMILSHEVTGLGTLVSGSKTTFTHEDIKELEGQPWVRRVGEFTASAFNVAATVEMGGQGMSTALFFESIPSEFFDVVPQDWTFDPDKPFIPIIISKDYLSLYNFGFAASRGLPQLSEAMIGMIPLRVSISGNGSQQWLPARIVGFSSRLNTIAVPEEFMQWANNRFGEDMGEPSRVIVEVKNPGDPAIDSYLKSHNLERAGEDNNRSSYFFTIFTLVVVAVGVVISALAFFILMLSIFLLMQKNKQKLHDLMQLGYSPSSVARRYWIIVASINFVIAAGAVAAMLVGRHLWKEPLQAIGMETVSPVVTIIVGMVIILVITGVNIIAISTIMRRYFR